MMKISTYFAIATVTLCSQAFVASAHEHGDASESDASAEQFEMIQLSCQELLALPEDDSDYAFTLLYGYAAGERGNPLLSISSAEQVITDAIDLCVSDPDLPVIDAFAISWKN